MTGYEKEPEYCGPPVKRWELPAFVAALVVLVLIALCGHSRAEGETPTKLSPTAEMPTGDLRLVDNGLLTYCVGAYHRTRGALSGWFGILPALRQQRTCQC